MNAAVEALDLVKVFRTSKGSELRAVDGISFQVRPGELFSLLGPNGAGKTTTIGMMSGLLSPTSGEVMVNDVSMTRRPLEAKAQIGIVPQEIALYPRLSARQNLAFFGQMYGLNGHVLRNRITELLEFVELADRADDKIEKFSSGMKRRVNIAGGLIHDPPILYMDEPTVGVDPQSRRRILDTIAHLKEKGIAILYTTHLMEEAEELSDRVAIIDHGKLIAVGTQEELTSRVNEVDRIEMILESHSPGPGLADAVRSLPGVSEVTIDVPDEEDATEGTRIAVLASDGRRLLPTLVETANRMGERIDQISVEEPNLESVFLAMTGRALRD
jgi:ABC-2 type transport system ATP-binding protein